MFVGQELRQAKWLEQVSGTLADTEAVSFDVLRSLLDSGTTLPHKPGRVPHKPGTVPHKPGTVRRTVRHY